MNEELLQTVELEPAQPATAAVIWMHGLGADAHDFEPVPPELGLPPELAVRFIFPNAPHRPVTINNGFAVTEVDQAKLLLRTGRWRIFYGDAVSVLLVRKTVDPLGDRISTPESAAKYFARGEAARKEGRLTEAIGFFERALEFESHHEGACKMLSIAERQLGHETRSLEVLERCHEIFPRHADEPHGA